MLSLRSKSTGDDHPRVLNREFSRFASNNADKVEPADAAVRRVVLRALVNLANEDGLCSPSLYQLAELTRLPLLQVERVVQQLQRLQHITVDCCDVFKVSAQFLPLMRRA